MVQTKLFSDLYPAKFYISQQNRSFRIHMSPFSAKNLTKKLTKNFVVNVRMIAN